MTSKRRPFLDIHVPLAAPAPVKRRYSVTADVVSMRRCPYQYGTFRVHRFAPAHQTQIWYGTVIHQVLDHCHAHYRGQPDPATAGRIPDDGQVLPKAAIAAWFEEIAQARAKERREPPPPSHVLGYFQAVDDSLRHRGVRAISPHVRIKAAMVLQHFNALEGPALYPRVIDTEHRLQADHGTHVLHGVIDLLAESPEAQAGECEIWDYKGVNPLHIDKRQMETYEFQMRVYARLYQLKHGVLPQRALLYFLNELPDDDTPPVKRPVHAITDVELTPALIETAMREFGRTVREIEHCRARDDWPPAKPDEISDKDCSICDLRWRCPTGDAPMRYP